MVNLDIMKNKFENDELVKDKNINSLELKLDKLLRSVAEINEDLAFDIDDVCGELASAYVNCCFKNGVKYGCNLNK